MLSSNVPQVLDTKPQQTNVSKVSHHTDAVPLVPGLQKYSDVHQNVISIVTDSMTNRIKQRDFNDALLSGKAIFKKFPGAIASEIKDYSATTIRENTPKGLIAVAGANDCSCR